MHYFGKLGSSIDAGTIVGEGEVDFDLFYDYYLEASAGVGHPMQTAS